jgi:drug/metabolite transporter (DMT)-like permease
LNAPAAAEAAPGDRRVELIGVGCVLISALALSLKGILAKYIFAEGVDVVTLLAVRYGLAFPMMVLAAAALRGGFANLAMAPRDFAYAAAGGLIGYYLAGYLDFTALKLIDVSVERVLLFSFPVFVVAFDAVRRRRWPPARQLVALIGAEAGIVLVMGATEADIFFANLVGGLWAIGSAFVFAIYFMINQALGPRLGSARMALGAVTGAVIGTTAQFVASTPVAALAMNWSAFAMIAAMALFCSVLPFLLITEGIRRVGASRSALISTVGPVSTLVLAALLLGETMVPSQLAGAALVIVAILALEGKLPPIFRRRQR